MIIIGALAYQTTVNKNVSNNMTNMSNMTSANSSSNGLQATVKVENGTFNPTTGILVDGQAKSLFTANTKGVTSVSTTIDNQTVSIAVTADPTLTNDTNVTNVTNLINSNSNFIKTSNTTIPMQHTGLPIAGLILAILSVFGGSIMSRKK